ncbi:hypothetical protein GCM10027180_35390 [Microbulbifer echini]
MISREYIRVFPFSTLRWRPSFAVLSRFAAKVNPHGRVSEPLPRAIVQYE